MIRRAASSLRRDTRGAATPFVAMMSVALLGAVGVALDIGLYYTENRNLQAMTEAAALSAAVDPSQAQSRAVAFLTRNGYSAATLQSIEVGHYCADKTLASTARFVTGTAPADCSGGTLPSTAVRLHTTGASHQYLSAILGGASPIPALAGVATAARIDEAGLEVTTGVLALDPGLVNSLLSLLAGRNIALTGVQIQSLAASNVDAGLMFDALAARVGETGTYGDLVKRTVSLGDLLAACQTATSDSTLAGALGTLAGQVGSSVQVPLAGLFGLGVWSKMPVGGANQKQSLRAGLNSYQLIAYALQTNNRTANPGKLDITIPGIAQVKLAGTASGPLERPRFSFGPAGETTVSTAVLRLKLVVTIANLNGLLDGLGLSVVNQLLLGPVYNTLGLSVDVPLLIEVGAGSSSINRQKGITCGQEASTDAKVYVDSTSGLLNVYLGNLPSDAMTQPFRALTASDVTPVKLVDFLGLLTVDIKAAVGPVFGASKTLEFRQTAGGDGIIGHPPYGGTPARIGNGSQLGPLLTSLGNSGNLSINATLLGIKVTTGQLLTNVTNIVITPIVKLAVTPLVDPLLDGVLGALGVQAGFADTWVTGVRCGVPVLV